MSTIAIAELKAHLSAELKKVRAGETIVVLDHKQPVARIVPLITGMSFSRRAKRAPRWLAFAPLMQADPLVALEAERADTW